MMKTKKLLFGLMFLILLSSFVSANFIDNFNSYDPTNNLQIESSGLWNCDGGIFDTNCYVTNGTRFEGNRYQTSSQIWRNFFDVASGTDRLKNEFVFNFETYSQGIGGSGIGGVVLFDDGNGAYNFSQGFLSGSNQSDYVVGAMGIGNSWSNSPGSCSKTGLKVFNPSTQAWVGYSADPTFPPQIIGGGYSGVCGTGWDDTVAIIVDFDTGTLKYQTFNGTGGFLSQHSVIYNLSSFVNSADTFAKVSVTNIDFFKYLIGNTAPSVTNVEILPIDFTPLDSINCNYDYFDADNDPDVSNIKWFINDVEQVGFENSDTLPAGNYNLNDKVKCQVTAFDGIDFGNVLPQTVKVGFGVIDEFEQISFSLSLADSESVAFDIQQLDYDDSNSFATGYFAYAGNDGVNSFIGIAELYDESSFGTFNNNLNSGTQTYVGISVLEDSLWSVSHTFLSSSLLQYYDGVDASSFNSATPHNFTNSPNNFYLDVEAVNDSYALVCNLDDSLEFHYLESYEFNQTSGNLEFRDAKLVSGCDSLAYDGVDVVVVETGVGGSRFYNVSNSSNLVFLDSVSVFPNAYDSNLGQSDMNDAFQNFYVNTIDMNEVKMYDFSNASDVVSVAGSCDLLPLDNPNAYIKHLDMFDEDLVVFENFNDNNLYVCDYSSGEVFKVLNSSNFVNGLTALNSGVLNYFYAGTNDELRIYKLSTAEIVAGVNQLPFFVSSTPDTQFIDNFNPIATNVTPVGIETPVVNAYPLNCLNPNIYDCSLDVEGDTILFAVDKENDGILDTIWSSFENLFVTYDSAGLKTLRIHITDDQHPNDLSTFRDFTINVSGVSIPLGENESTLKFLVKDSLTLEPVSSVAIDVDTQSVGFTNIEGEYTGVLDAGVYFVEFTKSGYLTKANYYGTSLVTQQVLLELEGDAERRTLVIIVKELAGNNSPVADAFVQVQGIVTGFADFKFTDANGQAVFYPSEDDLLVFVEADGYEIANLEVSVPRGSVVSREVLVSIDGFVIGDLSLTGCQDYIRGVVLCDYDKTACTLDSDCVTDYCNVNALTNRGECSNFNWTLCDDQNIQRGNRCIYKNVLNGTLRSVGDWITSNFFLVLLIVLLLVALLVLALRNK